MCFQNDLFFLSAPYYLLSHRAGTRTQVPHHDRAVLYPIELLGDLVSDTGIEPVFPP